MAGLFGSTRVRTDDGALVQLSDMVRQGVKGLHVFACDPLTGLVGMVGAVNPVITGEVSSITVVQAFDEPIYCTPDTQFMLADRTFKAAGDLVAGDVLRAYPSGFHTLTADAQSVTLKNPVCVFDMSVHRPGNYALVLGPFVQASGANWK